MHFQEKFFKYGDVSTKYLEKGSGQPLLFFIGGGVRVETFGKFLSDLSEKYHIIAPDLPPFGDASVPKEIWGLEEYGDYFLEFIKFLNIKNLIIAGFPSGAELRLQQPLKVGVSKD